MKAPPKLTPLRAFALLGLFVDYPGEWTAQSHARRRIREELENHVKAGLHQAAKRKRR